LAIFHGIHYDYYYWFAVNYFCLYVVFELGKGCGVAVAAAAIDLSSTVTCAKS
jgi:hypothetical protein